jgi:hypothetical protein
MLSHRNFFFNTITIAFCLLKQTSLFISGIDADGREVPTHGPVV